MKKIALMLALTSILTACGASTMRPVSMVSISGNPIRMNGNKISVVNDNINRRTLLRAVKSINDQLGFVLLTTDPVYESKIYTREDVLSYQHGDFGSAINGPIKETSNENLSYEDDDTTILGRASFDVPVDGVIKECTVTINYFIPDRRSRRNALRHELLHCLGLRDDEIWGSVMNEYFMDLNPKITDAGVRHLRRVYNGIYR